MWLKTYFEASGIFGWILAPFWILTAAFVAARIHYYRKLEPNKDLLKKLTELGGNLMRAKKDLGGVFQRAKEDSVNLCLQAATCALSIDRNDLKGSTEEACEEVWVPALEPLFKGHRWLVAIAFAAPLIGLAGTVVGLHQALETAAQESGVSTLKDLSPDFAVALLSTLLGIVPTVVAGTFIRLFDLEVLQQKIGGSTFTLVKRLNRSWKTISESREQQERVVLRANRIKENGPIDIAPPAGGRGERGP